MLYDNTWHSFDMTLITPTHFGFNQTISIWRLATFNAMQWHFSGLLITYLPDRVHRHNIEMAGSNVFVGFI